MKHLLILVHIHGLICGWLWGFLFFGWAAHLYTVENLDEDTPFVLTAQWRTWVTPIWRYSTTVGRCMIAQPHRRKVRELRQHEAVHIKQSEDRSALAFLIGLEHLLVTHNWLHAWLLWATGWAWQLPNFLTAAMRHGIKNVYEDSEHERSARSQTNIEPLRPNESWLDRRRELQ
jgi:hypothetical protein